MSARQMAILAFLIFGGGLLAGRQWGAAPLRVQLAELRSTHDQAQRLAAGQALQRLQAAQVRGDELTERLVAQEQSIITLTQEKRHALANTTTGRACLGPAALRVLDGAAGLRVARSADLPQAASGTAVADGAVATDTDIGTWAIAAGAQYERCRARLGALIDWHQEDHKDGRKDSKQ